MNRLLKFVNCILIAAAIFTFQSAYAREGQCGERISSEDVLVVDLEDFVEQQAVFKEKLHEQAGDFILMTESPIKVKMKGNRANAINSASKSAAKNGCDLLALLGESVTETRWQSRVTSTRYLMVHMGKRESR